MNISIDNFTVSVVSFIVATGEEVTEDYPSILLLITPNPGYSIDAANFSAVAPLPTHVSSVTFSQNLANIYCTVNFSSPFIMPDFDVFVSLCLQGSAELKKYSIDGVVNFDLTNTVIPNSSPPPSPVAYSGLGDFNNTLVVFTQAVTPISGGYFPTEPTLELTTGNASRYNITSTKTYAANGQLVQINFTVSYTFGKSSVSGDVLTLTAAAIATYVPVVEITSYTINRANVPTAGGYRTMIVYGNAGAAFSIDMNGTSLVTGAVMDSTGSYSFDIVFPSVTAYTLYTITLSGDLASPFNQSNPFTIGQFTDTQITFDIGLSSDFTPVTPVIKSYTAFQTPAFDSAEWNIDINFNLLPTPTLVSGSGEIFIISQPLATDWSNTDPLLNGGSEFFPEAVITLNNPPTTGTLTTSGFVQLYGGSDVTSVLDLSSLIGVRSIPTLSTKSITGGTVTEATTGGELISDNGGAITIKGVEWSASSDFAILLGTTLDGSGETDYNSLITGLTPGGTYYTRAYAINVVGTGYGQILPFVAIQPKNIPTVVTTVVTFPTDATQALSGGESINDDGQPITVKGVQWSTTSNFSSILGTTNDGTGNLDYSSTMTNLTPGDTYYVRAYATSAVGTGYGNVISFSTSVNISCGTVTNIPVGGTGYYNLDFATGTSTGAILVYFNPSSIPDGIRVLYDGAYYNTATNNNNGRIQATSGVADAFTFLGSANNSCMPSSYPNTQSYTFYDGIVNNAWNNTGTTQTLTINQGDYVGGGRSTWSTLVIPKPSASPSVVSIQVLGHCGTIWQAFVNCPAILPSVTTSLAQSTDACNTSQNTLVYFAQNRSDTNTTPRIGNFVFTDQNGVTPLNNTSTVLYYITGNTAFSVLNGVVVSSGACT